MALNPLAVLRHCLQQPLSTPVGAAGLTLPPLKSKVAAVKAVEDCEHRAERLMRGSHY